MALLDSELARIKWHLGFNLLDVGATPYIGVAAIFEQVIQPTLTVVLRPRAPPPLRPPRPQLR